jgi:peptidoglycan/LPS O-acetylase OafA/YrhL
VLFPIILFFCKKWGIEITLLLAFITSFVIWSVMFLLFHIFHNLDIGASGVHPYIILFVTGMLAANLSFNSAYFTNGSWKKWLPLIFFTLTIILLNRLSRGNTTQDILVGVITMWLLIGINNPKNNFLLGYLNKAFSWHPFVWLGSFAYSIYLFHPLFIQLLWMYIINPLKLDNFTSYFLFILLGTPIILLLCYLSFLLFENPFLKYRKKKGLFENNLKVASEPVP